MKILIVRNAFSHDFGGAERLAVHLAEELKNNAIDTIVISRQTRLLTYAEDHGIKNKKGWWWSHQNWSGWQVLGIPFYLGWQLALFCWYVCVFLRYQPDVIHLMSKDDFIAGTLAAKILGKGVIWTDPADLKHVFRNHAIFYKNPVGKLVYFASRFTDIITLVSESERKLVTESVGHNLSDKFIVVHTAGRDEKVVPLKRNPQDESAVIFCSTSRLVYAKGITELIDAFLKLSKDADVYRLWLIGNGPDEEAFKKQARNNSFITFIGHSDTPLRYVAAADVFVHPTHHEGFSLSLAEAAMLAKPMIATNVGGNPELVNNTNGLLVPVKNSEEFFKAMEKLGSNAKLRQTLGKNARKDYVTKFDFSTIVKTMLIPLYEKISA